MSDKRKHGKRLDSSSKPSDSTTEQKTSNEAVPPTGTVAGNTTDSPVSNRPAGTTSDASATTPTGGQSSDPVAESAASKSSSDSPTPAAGPEPLSRSEPSASKEPSAHKEPSANNRKQKSSSAIEGQSAAHAATGGGSGKGGGRPPEKRGGGWRRLLLWVVALLLIAALIGAGLVAAQRALEAQGAAQSEQNAELQNRLDSLQQQLAQNQQRMDELVENQEQSSRERAGREQQLANQLDAVEERLAEHSDRLRALSTTTREDWLLAEVEYLLKLANQRMMIERSTQAAQALLQQADEILRDLNDTRVTPLRRAIARDLAQLKLSTQVDLEGLYMRLASLAEKVPEIPALPQRDVPAPQRQQSDTAESDTAPAETPWWDRAWGTAKSMFSDFDEYVRIRDHGETPEPILPPDAAQYLQQNLRLMLEKAQLAAMREETAVYQRSLQNAAEWARRFYPESQPLENFTEELQQLADVNVEQNLPDISQSLIMVTQYIDRLHKLEGVDPGPEGQDAGGDSAETQP